MSINRFGEVELFHCTTDSGDSFFITRDRGGMYVLRSGGFDGKELFATRRDDGKKNTKKGRVASVELLYDVIDSVSGGHTK